MASPSVTYTFINGSNADATQVNQNFTDLIASLTDGTKDLSINNLSLAGSLSVTGSFSSSLIPVTNALYNLGSSSLGWATVYVGDGTKTVGIVSTGLTVTYTLTLPVSLPTQITNLTISSTGAMATGRPSAPGHAITSGSGSFSTTSAVAVGVTNLSVAYTRLRTGSPIFIELIPDASGTAIIGAGTSSSPAVPVVGIYCNKSGTGVIGVGEIETYAGSANIPYGDPGVVKFVDTTGAAPIAYFLNIRMIIWEL